MKKSIVFVIAFISVFVLAGTVHAKITPDKNTARKRVVVHTIKEETSAVALGCEVVRNAKTLKALSCPQGVAESLSLPEDVRVFALPGNQITATGNPQPSTASADANQQIGVNLVHVSGNTGVGRKIAVLDTGYDYTHPELKSSYLGGKDFSNNDNDPMDDNGHGSHVSGIITADGIDPKAKGVAPSAGIVVGKVLDYNGAGYFSDVVAGIYWAVNGPDGAYGTKDDFKVDAINISLGTDAPYMYTDSCDTVLPDMTTAIKYAVQKNIPVIAASGNNGSAGVSIPGCISAATTVGSLDATNVVTAFSGRGNALDITAPGTNIYSTTLGGSYASWSGTSMSTPIISGVVALIKSKHPTYTQKKVEGQIFSTALDLGTRGKDSAYGNGKVRANLAAK
jgi:subtilisin family serine protease